MTVKVALKKLRALQLLIKAGVDALDRGDFIEVDERDLDEYLKGLTSADPRRSASGKPARRIISPVR